MPSLAWDCTAVAQVNAHSANRKTSAFDEFKEMGRFLSFGKQDNDRALQPASAELSFGKRRLISDLTRPP